MVVPVFDGTHYECWSVKMKTFLKAIDLWNVVETGIFQQEEISSAYQKFEEVSQVASTERPRREEERELKLLMTSGLHLQQEERIIAMEAQTQMQQLVPVFNGNEYELWSIKMRTLLMSRDLWDVIESETSDQPMEEELVKSQRIKDMSALYMLQMSVSDTIFLRIARATSSKQACELLKAEFGETESIRDMKKQNVGMMYENLIMGEEESVDEFVLASDGSCEPAKVLWKKHS
ncbi:unnamed protein product [Brassica napus]|uniref:(rape) hypothetical protein n=1 Tax=Brassica napus TaxID=3708 RepID=A0A816I3H0_BRANA|nr:unnamed protein product [Brassica napus]